MSKLGSLRKQAAANRKHLFASIPARMKEFATLTRAQRREIEVGMKRAIRKAAGKGEL